jgi:hypothetical protein
MSLQTNMIGDLYEYLDDPADIIYPQAPKRAGNAREVVGLFVLRPDTSKLLAMLVE